MRDLVASGQHPVRAVMTGDVVVARPDTSVRDVAELMGALRLRLLPVVEGVQRVEQRQRVVGVVSVDDLARRGLIPGRVKGWRRKVASGSTAEVMSAPAVTVPVDATVAAAARAMVERGVRALPVVDGDERLHGIVTDSDLVKTLVRSDDELAVDVAGVLQRYLPSVSTGITSVVRDGVVTLNGRPPAQWMVPLAVHLVRTVAGVVDVDDRLGRTIQETDEGPLSSSHRQRSVGSVDSRTP